MKVLIDGENLRHQLAHVLYHHKKLLDKNAYFTFDFIGFMREALRAKELEAIYYTTRVKQPQAKVPIKLQKRIAAISEANRRLIADLTNQKIQVVKAGHLRVRESSTCIHCGKKTLVLQEKGVDVRLATDLALTAQRSKQSNVILASSDSDLLPAIEAARQNRTHITYFCYAGRLNRSVASKVQKVMTFDDDLVIKYFTGTTHG